MKKRETNRERRRTIDVKVSNSFVLESRESLPVKVELDVLHAHFDLSAVEMQKKEMIFSL